jgi:hypothetical protein
MLDGGGGFERDMAGWSRSGAELRLAEVESVRWAGPVGANSGGRGSCGTCLVVEDAASLASRCSGREDASGADRLGGRPSGGGRVTWPGSPGLDIVDGEFALEF